MARIRVRRTVDATAEDVWRQLEDISNHVNWMDDALAIRFRSERTRGVGTTFDCDTRIGPFRTTDRMRVTEWRPNRSFGVDHVGLVRGQGRFVLRRRRGGRTELTWEERLRFPWWLGGPVTALGAKPILRRVWKKNLRNLAAQL